MKIKSSEKVRIAGQRAQLVRTRVFHGAVQEVWVVFFETGGLPHRIVGRRIGKSEFMEVLKGIRFNGENQRGQQGAVSNP